MSSQEPEPKQQPHEEREVNYDSQEQTQPEIVPPEVPPQEYPSPQQEYPLPQGYAGPAYTGPAVSPRRRRGLLCGCLIALVIVLFLCAGVVVGGTILGFGLGIGDNFRNSVTEPTPHD